ncbi:secretion protein HlyD [Streptomyces sp. NPDC051064]|uniref:secretion protein HlyD n=1 Tax=Streptomyces sp. NPDC051064 TaxID=3365641 RepID=UPI00379EE758
MAAALGLAYAEGDMDRGAALLKGVDPQTAGAVLLALTGAWVGALDLVAEAAGESDPRAHTKRLLYAEALESAAE